jgi:hypothetical protein
MQEIGTWTTSEGTVSATLVLDSEIDDVSAQELPGWASGALSGALGGAATGAAAGALGSTCGRRGRRDHRGRGRRHRAGAAEDAAAGRTILTTVCARGSSAPVGGARSSAIQALQQFAAAVPALIQLVAASGAPAKTGKPSELSDSDGIAEFVSEENLGIDEWTTASEDEGAWTIP